jgi:PAS domain S-box-containing protein
MGNGRDERRAGQDVTELRQRLEEAEETLRAISRGEVDALVVDSPDGESIYTLTSADFPYRLMIDEMNEGAVTVALDTMILYTNRNFATLLGSDETKMRGASFNDFVLPRMRAQFVKDLQNAREQSTRREYVLKTAAGEEVTVLLSFAKFQPRTNAVSIVVSDLTAQKELQGQLRQAKDGLEQQVAERTKALQESEVRLFEILKHSDADLKAMRRLNEIGTRCAREGNDFYACLNEILDVAIEITRADKGSIQLVDATTGALTIATHSGFKRPFLEFFANAKNVASACGAAIKSLERVIIEDVNESELFAGTPSLQVLREAGVRAVQSTPLVSSGGKILGIISTHFDTPILPSEQELRLMDLLARQSADFLERKRVQEEREQLLESEHELREQAEEANRLKDEFLAIMSHELRNPLNVILGYSEVLLRSRAVKESEDLKRMVDAVKRNAVAQSKLIRDLLDLSRLRSGKLELNRETVALVGSIDNAVETVRMDAAAKDISIEIERPDEALFVEADPVRLEQILWNLLNNSVKFTPAGGTITVRARADNGEVVLTVEDNGQGIEPIFLPHLFKMFRQGDAGTTRLQSGMGVGLAVVRQLIDLHKGSISAYSDGPGEGSVFTIRLPGSAEIKDSAAPVPNLHPGALESIAVLVVDDSEDTAAMVREVLEMSGATVTTATSGFEALKLASERHFDVVVSDISMPGMDGFEFLGKLRKIPGKENLPALALTGFGRTEDVYRARSEGFFSHITKPLDIEILTNLLQRIPRNGQDSRL